jgi:hypothetical protein
LKRADGMERKRGRGGMKTAMEGRKKYRGVWGIDSLVSPENIKRERRWNEESYVVENKWKKGMI